MVLKQCGQEATIVRAPASFSVSMFWAASIENTNSLPIRRAGSPVQVSAGPSTANFTPAVCSSEAIALVVLRARSSSAPAQPTQNRYSTSRLDRAVDHGDLEVQFADPVRPPGRAHPPRVALVLQVPQHPGRLDRERGLDQHLVPPHPVDVVDVLDVHRALLHARPAVRAGPQHVRVDHPVDLGAVPTSGRPASALTASGSFSRSSSEAASRYGALANA